MKRSLDDEYPGKSIPLSLQYSRVIAVVNEKWEDQTFLIFSRVLHPIFKPTGSIVKPFSTLVLVSIMANKAEVSHLLS